MSHYSLSFDSPAWLALLLVAPVLWVVSFRSLAGLGRWRRAAALALRTAILAMIVLALAEVRIVRNSDELTVIYVVDATLSVPEPSRRWMLDFINKTAAQHRADQQADRVGVVVFGREAAVEVPPYDVDLQLPPVIESTVNPQYTNLAGALRLALAMFPHDSAKRVVVMSDGNENMGDVRDEARVLADAGVSIDVVPVHLSARGEVSVDKVTLPSDVQRGQPFNLRIVVNRQNVGDDPAPLDAVLQIKRKSSDKEVLLAEQSVKLSPGKRVFTIREEIDQPDFYTYEARLILDDLRYDGMPQNNRATSFTYVRGKGRVLFIEDFEHAGEFDGLVDRLRNDDLEVTVQPSNMLFGSLAELQSYDTVVMANVPRTSGTSEADITTFSDRKIDMLVSNTHDLGSGLILIGGPNSFGAGGWTNTALEKAMPVDFQIKSPQVIRSGALMIVIDRSGSMSGEKIELAKYAAVSAVKTLGKYDYIGVLAFDSTVHHVVQLQHVGEHQKIINQIGRLNSGGGTDMWPAMTEGYDQLRKVQAGAKHMIVLTDGMTNGSGYQDLARRMRAEQITVSAVAIGGDAAVDLLAEIAQNGGGKYYAVRSPAAIPKIFMKEAQRVARPLIWKDDAGVNPQVVFPHEMLKGIGPVLPPITGFVLTTKKESNLVEVSIRSPRPVEPENSTILASWTYGLGKAVAFTTDAGARFATAWTGWENYDKLFSQMVRWSMRPVGDEGKFNIATDIADGKARVIVTALDQENAYMNFLSMSGTAVGPDMQPINVEFEQAAPGRYVGEFDATDAGSYFLLVNPGVGQQMLRAGLNVGYSDEFRTHDTNEPLLHSLAELAPEGGEPGRYVDPEPGAQITLAAEDSPFRRDLPTATASREAWHWFVLVAACVFVGDVLIRRVYLELGWLVALSIKLRDRLLRRTRGEETVVTISRLKNRKQQVDQDINRRRAAATRFEPQPELVTASVAEDGQDALAGATARPSPTRPSPTPAPAAAAEEDSYTSRLLAAKKKVWEERGR